MTSLMIVMNMCGKLQFRNVANSVVYFLICTAFSSLSMSKLKECVILIEHLRGERFQFVNNKLKNVFALKLHLLCMTKVHTSVATVVKFHREAGKILG